eukprot:6153288-Pleurochrysis_carterae.AAC.1
MPSCLFGQMSLALAFAAALMRVDCLFMPFISAISSSELERLEAWVALRCCLDLAAVRAEA